MLQNFEVSANKIYFDKNYIWVIHFSKEGKKDDNDADDDTNKITIIKIALIV
jgi:hypothetical protein